MEFPHRRASGRILVAYVATDYGKDALNLGIALAKERDVSLDIVMIAPRSNSFSGVYPHDRGYSSILEEHIAMWLEEALASIPKDIDATARIVLGDSEAEALNDAAVELNCDMIVVGARKGGILSRFHMGAAVNALLHSATVPIALAPKGYAYPGPISRLTCMFGPRSGSVDVISNAIDRASKRGVELRLVSLVIHGESDLQGLGNDVPNAIRQYADRVLGDIAQHVLDDGKASTVVASGNSVEEAVSGLAWDPGEIVIVGSSRLAVPGRLFIGTTASRMLRSVPVPMVVIPNGYMTGGETDG